MNDAGEITKKSNFVNILLTGQDFLDMQYILSMYI